MGSRLVVILDDLLWVLTDSQLKAALHFVDSLSGLIQKATSITRKAKAARKLEVRLFVRSAVVFVRRSKSLNRPHKFDVKLRPQELPEYRAQVDQQTRTKEGDSQLSKIFNKFDVVETSYHFLSHQIILHLCDDPGGECHVCVSVSVPRWSNRIVA